MICQFIMSKKGDDAVVVQRVVRATADHSEALKTCAEKRPPQQKGQ
jgi:hypothetical protein